MLKISAKRHFVRWLLCSCFPRKQYSHPGWTIPWPLLRPPVQILQTSKHIRTMFQFCQTQVRSLLLAKEPLLTAQRLQHTLQERSFNMCQIKSCIYLYIVVIVTGQWTKSISRLFYHPIRFSSLAHPKFQHDLTEVLYSKKWQPHNVWFSVCFFHLIARIQGCLTTGYGVWHEGSQEANRRKQLSSRWFLAHIFLSLICFTDFNQNQISIGIVLSLRLKFKLLSKTKCCVSTQTSFSGCHHRLLA